MSRSRSEIINMPEDPIPDFSVYHERERVILHTPDMPIPSSLEKC